MAKLTAPQNSTTSDDKESSKHIRPANTNSEAHVDDVALLDALQHSAHRLSKCSLDSELLAGVRELQCFIQNIRCLLKARHSVEDELCASWPIRNWLRLVPRGHNRLAADDPLFVMYLANYETVVLAVCKRLPQLGVGLSVDDRTNAVSRMRQVIDNLTRKPAEEVAEKEEHMRALARQALSCAWELCEQSLLLQ